MLDVELTDSGMEYYFLRPLKLAKTGFFDDVCQGIAMLRAVFCLFESGKDCKGLRAEALRVVEAEEWLR